MRELEWIFVKGGTCGYGDYSRPRIVPDLLWSATTVTLGSIDAAAEPELQMYPATNLNYDEANEIALAFHCRLPTSVEWEWMAAGGVSRIYPWGDLEWTQPKANLRDSHIGAPLPVGSFPEGMTPDGLLDVAGNVWEWTSSTLPNDGAILRGGSYDSLALYARNKFLNAAPKELRSPGIGLRLVRNPA